MSASRQARIEQFKEMTLEQVIQAGHAPHEHPTWDETVTGFLFLAYKETR